MAEYEETAVIIEKEIEELSSLEKFNRFICLCTYHHVNRCENDDCGNCTFVNKLCHIYHGNYMGGENEVLNLQKICRKYFGNLSSLTVFLKSLASIEREKRRFELEFNDLLEIWNANIKQ